MDIIQINSLHVRGSLHGVMAELQSCSKRVRTAVALLRSLLD